MICKVLQYDFCLSYLVAFTLNNNAPINRFMSNFTRSTDSSTSKRTMAIKSTFSIPRVGLSEYLSFPYQTNLGIKSYNAITTQQTIDIMQMKS